MTSPHAAAFVVDFLLQTLLPDYANVVLPLLLSKLLPHLVPNLLPHLLRTWRHSFVPKGLPPHEQEEGQPPMCTLCKSCYCAMVVLIQMVRTKTYAFLFHGYRPRYVLCPRGMLGCASDVHVPVVDLCAVGLTQAVRMRTCCVHFLSWRLPAGTACALLLGAAK